MFVAFFVSVVAAASPPPAVALPGEDAYLAARESERAGRFADAVNGYEACSETEGPLRPYALARIVLCRAAAGADEDTVTAFARLADAFPQGPWIRMVEAEWALALFGRNQHAAAAPRFQSVMAVDLLPWWYADIEFAAARNLAAIPERAPEGYAALQKIVEGTLNRKRRIEASELLAASPNPEHRLDAIAAMVRSGDYEAAARALAPVPFALLGTPERQARWQYLKGRTLLASGEPEQGRALLEAVAREHASSEWAAFALNHLARSLLSAKKATDASAVFDRLFEGYRGSEAAGDALWWRGNLAKEKNDYDAAMRDYMRLAGECRNHPRADDALMAAAELLLERAQPAKAAETWSLLTERYPASPLYMQALYTKGRLQERSGDLTGARAAYTQAANGPLGDYYTHCALARLHTREWPLPIPTRALDVAPGKALLRAAALDDAASPPAAPAAWSAQPWHQRLFFFAAHGLEESEWEALEIAETHRLASAGAFDDGAGALYGVLADAGLAMTAARLLNASGWGMDDGKPTNARLRVFYPRAYWGAVCAMARETRLDPCLLLAVARQESTFRPRVTSSAGAVGLMQLMPGTAEWLAQVEPTIGTEHLANLEHPENSMRLGAQYLMRMVRRSEGNLVFAVASYNAGPGNVAKWKKHRLEQDLDLFIEEIPFSETRDFVKRVLGNYAAYHSLYQAASGGSEPS